MTALLVSHRFRTLYGDAFLADATARGIALEYVVLPDDPEARLADELAARAEVAYFSSDVFPKFGKPFFSATRKAADLKWLHVFNAGVDHPVFASILERGVPYELEWSYDGRPFLTPRGDLVDAVSRAIKTVTGLETELSTTGGTSDGRFIADICPQLIECGPTNASIHKINECIRVDELVLLPQIYLHTLNNLLLR